MLAWLFSYCALRLRQCWGEMKKRNKGIPRGPGRWESQSPGSPEALSPRHWPVCPSCPGPCPVLVLFNSDKCELSLLLETQGQEEKAAGILVVQKGPARWCPAWWSHPTSLSKGDRHHTGHFLLEKKIVTTDFMVIMKSGMAFCLSNFLICFLVW